METRARFILLGFFTLAVIMAGFGFVYWLNYAGTLGEQATYRIRFQDTVSGLRPGSAVLFNGIRVGEVKSLRLDPEDPRAVTATISVDRNTPVRADTKADIFTQGLMGSPTVSLQGGEAGAQPFAQAGKESPLLVAAPDAGRDIMLAAREALRRLDSVLVENAEPLRDTIANLKSFTDALARNSDRVDSIAKGLERMVGGSDKAAVASFDLSAPADIPGVANVPSEQLVIPEPTATLLLDTRRILFKSGSDEAASFPDAQWADNLPKLIQSRLVQSFENAKYGRVAGDIDDFDAKYKLLIDLRKIRLADTPAPTSEVEIGAKVMTDGQIVAARVFRATAPANATGAPGAAAAIDAAFGTVVKEIIPWTIGVLAK
jgi:phospholipid/cholesterol/gamma-HCH transport system substrate-binding protein